MKILFIENRYRTLFWEAIAERLAGEGHEIYFLVQNRSFRPHFGRVTVLPYPKRNQTSTPNENDLRLIRSDRNINYFGHRDTGHYAYYRRVIGDYLKRERPDVVFGESTAFHELITIDLCKKMQIPYLQPCTCRFPTGRFSFYRYDTLEPFSGSGEVMSDKEAEEMIGHIVRRDIKPDYMRKRRVTLRSRWKRLCDLAHHSLAYLRGEHYNTPAPWVKWRIERAKNRLIDRWDALAKSRSEEMEGKGFRILYAMQMQPEANLDVWGSPYRDQERTIRMLVENTPDDVLIVVKPNPKSKYELTDHLLDYMASESRIVPVCHSMSMDRVLPSVDMVVTVTGTIAIECILSGIPILTLIETLNNRMSGCPLLRSFDELPEWVECVRNGRFPISDGHAKIGFINLLNRTSFKGLPYETALDEANISVCQVAFDRILDGLTRCGEFLPGNGSSYM